PGWRTHRVVVFPLFAGRSVPNVVNLRREVADQAGTIGERRLKRAGGSGTGLRGIVIERDRPALELWQLGASGRLGNGSPLEQIDGLAFHDIRLHEGDRDLERDLLTHAAGSH